MSNGQEPIATPKGPLAEISELQCYYMRESLDSILHMPMAPDPYSLARRERRDQVAGLLYLVAICDRINWDFLLGPVAKKLSDLTAGFSVDGLRTLSDSDFRSTFDGYRRSDGGLELPRRLADLRELADFVEKEALLDHLLTVQALAGPNGILALVSGVPVYDRDPLRKKANAFVHELLSRELISVVDPDRARAAVDYHLIRLYLRTQRVMLKDRDLADRLVLRKRVRIEATTQIRGAVAEAMAYTATMLGVPLARLNAAEWAFARRGCRRDFVLCAQPGGCPLQRVCPSAGYALNTMLAEPRSKHGFY